MDSAAFTLALPLAELSADELVSWFFFFLVVVLPILRSVFGKIAEQRGDAPSPEPEEDRVDEDDDAWKRLLRGETVEPVDPLEPAQPEPRPVQARRRDPAPPPPVAVPPIQPRTWTENDREGAADGPGALDVLERARRGAEALPSAGGQAAMTELAEFHSTMEDVAGLGGELSVEFAALSEITDVPDRDAARALRRRHYDWRQAVVTREVLGTPVALRNGDDELLALR